MPYYNLDMIISLGYGMLSFLTTWHCKEGEMPSPDTISGIRDALMNGCRGALMKCSSNRQMMEYFMKIKEE